LCARATGDNGRTLAAVPFLTCVFLFSARVWTMSRRSNKSGGSSSATGPTSSHPAEQYPEHRKFLIRSLERNDADLAALVDLNRSLHKVKEAIINSCGELTLLDLGDGKIQLSADAENLQGELSDNVDKELCIDFLLRMKLRRKLLNRLARRLNRVAHAMDGEDVTPPGPPKYGDLRLHVDPEAVQAYTEHWERQEAARKRIEEEREKYVYKESKSADKDDDGEGTKQEEKPGDEVKSSPAKEPKTEEQTTEQQEGTEAKVASNEVGENKEERKPEEMEQKQEEQPSTVEQSKVEAPPKAEESQETAVKQEDTKLVEPSKTEEVSSDQEEKADDPQVKVDPLEADYEALREYKDAYEKVLDPASGTFRYTLLDQEHEEDYAAIKYGAGIGATHRSMSAKEKEAEFKRWQTSLLARIPEQPTFEELGLQNRVFLLEERRKRALDEEEASTPKKKKSKGGGGGGSSQKKKAEVASEDSDSDAMDIDEEEKSEKDTDSEGEDKMDEDHEDKDEKASDDERKEDEKAEDKGTPKKGDKENKEDDKAEEGDEPPKILKPISLAAVPSFYDQDLKRVKIIHADLMATSMHDHARRRLEEVTRDYNMGKPPLCTAVFTISASFTNTFFS